MTKTSRLERLAVMAGINPRVLGRGFPPELVDRMLAAAIDSDDPVYVFASLLEDGREATIRDGFLSRRPSVGDARCVVEFVRNVRAAVARFERSEIAARTQRESIVSAMEAAKTGK